MTNQPADGSIPEVIAYDAEVNSLVVALVYAADSRGDTDLGEGSRTHQFINAFCDTIFDASDENNKVLEEAYSLFLGLVEARESRNPVQMITSLKRLQEIVGVTVIEEVPGV